MTKLRVSVLAPPVPNRVRGPLDTGRGPTRTRIGPCQGGIVGSSCHWPPSGRSTGVGDGAARASQVSECRCSIDQAIPDYENEKMKGGLMGQRHRRLVAASCCIWLLTVVALVSCQNAPDVAEAVTWWRLAAEQGHASAQYNLGLMYGNGEGVPQDDAEAVRWYRLAADQGRASAQNNLGGMYSNGRGVPQDAAEAHMWANLAAAQGHENARELRDTLAEAISAVERPAIVPEADWTAHAYTVVREEDISSSIRIRRRLWIIAPTAQTPEARIATLMEAAIHVHRQSYPQFLLAFLLPFDTAEYAMARISYAPDGCEVSGSDCTGDMWTDAAASDGVVTATQLVIRKDWNANRDRFKDADGFRDRFKDADGFVEEPRLYQFLADKHSLTTEAVRAEMLGFAEATWPGKTMELPDDLRTKGELTEGEQAKLADVACRADLQCWGDKHSLRATRPCQLAIEKLALYDYEWTDGWLGVKFDSFAWKDREAGTLAYRGSEIKFQNAFGAWRRASYWCDYAPNTQTVLDVRVF